MHLSNYFAVLVETAISVRTAPCSALFSTSIVAHTDYQIEISKNNPH